MAEGLEDDRARRVAADRLLLEVDTAGAQVGQRPDRARQVAGEPDGEAVPRDHGGQHALRQRAARVARAVKRAAAACSIAAK